MWGREALRPRVLGARWKRWNVTDNDFAVGRAEKVGVASVPSRDEPVRDTHSAGAAEIAAGVEDRK